MALRFLPYEASRTVPNIVVDGSANDATVVTLSHWPGAPTPPDLLRDLSAEIAFAYLGEPCDHPPADVVTNNHFDQDGLVSIFTLVEPERALAHRELLIDLAAAGDFATYRDRRAARASMVLSRLAEQQPTDMSYDAFTAQLYTGLLPRVVDLVTDVDAHRDLWAEEDEQLTASEAAIAGGASPSSNDPTSTSRSSRSTKPNRRVAVTGSAASRSRVSTRWRSTTRPTVSGCW